MPLGVLKLNISVNFDQLCEKQCILFALLLIYWDNNNNVVVVIPFNFKSYHVFTLLGENIFPLQSLSFSYFLHQHFFLLDPSFVLYLTLIQKRWGAHWKF